MRFGLAALIASAVFTVWANAQQAPSHDERWAAVRAACETDFQTYCSQSQPRTPERRQCIETNRSKFSQACQDALAKMHREHGDNPPSQPN